MPTLSFDFPFAPGNDDFEPPENGYSISLHADVGDPTKFETDCVTARTAPAYLKLRGSLKPTDLRIEIRGKPHELADLRASHYTWRVQRNDGLPMRVAELQFAFMMQLCQGERKPAFSIPRSSLDQLLAADKTLSHALVNAMAEAEPMQREVHIPDADIAAGLVDLGLITPSAEPCLYALMDIEVQ